MNGSIVSITKPSDTELVEIYRQATQQPRWPTSECPTSSALESFCSGQLSDQLRLQIADHLGTCGQCASLVQDLRALEGWSERVATTKKSARSPVRGRWFLALAAVLIATLGIGFVLSSGVRQPVDTLRGQASLVRPATGTEVDRAPGSFSWPAEIGATGYQVSVRDTSGETVWLSAWETDPTTALPAAVGEALKAGTYLWSVEVRGPVERAELGPFSFALRDGS